VKANANSKENEATSASQAATSKQAASNQPRRVRRQMVSA